VFPGRDAFGLKANLLYHLYTWAVYGVGVCSALPAVFPGLLSTVPKWDGVRLTGIIIGNFYDRTASIV